MVAIIFMTGTKDPCKLQGYYANNDLGQIWFQSSLKRGPNIIAIMIIKGTKYACNLKSKTDHIWLQSSKICFREIGPEIIVT